MQKVKKKRKPAAILMVIFSICIVFALGMESGILYEKISQLPEYGVTVTAEDLSRDRLLTLVNSRNPIPEGYAVTLVELDNGEKVDSEMYPDLQEMFDDMRTDGLYPVVSEGYRTDAEQRQMMAEKIEAYRNEGYPEKMAAALAEEYVAVPGKSEHQLGLAVDINADKSKSDNEEVYAWLAENAYRYGFILRYPADKQTITGTAYEPWHYRYVGREYAEEIFQSGLCLEEWINERGEDL